MPLVPRCLTFDFPEGKGVSWRALCGPLFSSPGLVFRTRLRSAFPAALCNDSVLKGTVRSPPRPLVQRLSRRRKANLPVAQIKGNACEGVLPSEPCSCCLATQAIARLCSHLLADSLPPPYRSGRGECPFLLLRILRGFLSSRVPAVVVAASAASDTEGGSPSNSSSHAGRLGHRLFPPAHEGTPQLFR